MPAVVGVDLGVQGFEFLHTLAVEIFLRAPLVLLEELLDADKARTHDVVHGLVHRLG